MIQHQLYLETTFLENNEIKSLSIHS